MELLPSLIFFVIFTALTEGQHCQLRAFVLSVPYGGATSMNRFTFILSYDSIQSYTHSFTHWQRLTTERNIDGPWPYCLFLQFELCEAYLHSQADDIWISRVYPNEFHYNRIVIRVDDFGITSTTPGRGQIGKARGRSQQILQSAFKIAFLSFQFHSIQLNSTFTEMDSSKSHTNGCSHTQQCYNCTN